MADDAVDTTLPPLTLGRSLWAVRDEVLPRLIEAHRVSDHRGLQRLAMRATAATPKAARRTTGTRAGGAVAVIPLTGVLTPRYSFLSYLFGGGGGLVDFREAFREALNSPDVGAIVLDVDSPGGLIDLVPETAAEIRDARGTKPIVAVANTMAASGAYWIAAQADELVVTPSGSVGSVGVYMVHEDWSGWNEQQGIQPTYISAGRFKTEGNPDEPLSDEARADWQQEVDDLYAMFVADIAAGRNVTADVVQAQYGEGRTLIADRALAAGMVDRIDTIETVIGALLAPGSTGTAAARAGRASIVRPARAEVTPPPAGAETDPPAPPAPADPPAEDPPPADPPADDPPPADPPAEDPPVEQGAEERSAIAALLI
jgi:signal peptide peptidase SppA